MATARRFPCWITALTAALGLAMAAGVPASAQTGTGGPIRFIVGYAPGGTSDVSARVVGEALSQSIGQTVLVENRPGAQGGIAIDLVARAKPDGTTFLVSPGEALYQRALDEHTEVDSGRLLVPVTILTSQPIVIAANPKRGWKSLADMIAAAKSNPTALSYATPAVGGTNTIVAEMMFRRAGVKILNIPYKGGGQAVQDLLSGVVPLGVLGSAPLIPYVKSGKLTLLAVTSKDRSATLPDVPTLAELGYSGIDMTQWFAVFAPAGTSMDIVNRMSTELHKVLADPKVKDRLVTAALETVGGSPVEFAGRLKAEGAAWLKTAHDFGLDKN